MKPKLLIILLVAAVVGLIGSGSGLAGDMDDGISKFTDGAIAKDDELGERDPNLSYIMMKAAGRTSTEDDVVGTDRGASMNSAIIGPGGNIKGDIIIIDNSRGDKTQVVK